VGVPIAGAALALSPLALAVYGVSTMPARIRRARQRRRNARHARQIT
jgi:hypothetical protein